MAWEGSNRAQRLPKNWQRLRESVFKRDGYQCVWVDLDGAERTRCIAPAEECDHIRPGDDHSMTNLRSLCSAHHKLKSSREGAYAHRPRRPRKRPSSGQPGMF